MKKLFYEDKSELIDEMLDLLTSSFTFEELINEIRKWEGDDKFAHILEDIADDYDLLEEEHSDVYREFEGWYNNLTDSEQADVDDMAYNMGISDYSEITEDQFNGLRTIFGSDDIDEGDNSDEEDWDE